MRDFRIVFLRFCRPESARNEPSIEGQEAVNLLFQRDGMSDVTQEGEAQGLCFSAVGLLQFTEITR